MNKDIFLNGFVDRIAARFSLTSHFAFEILAIAAVLDLTFDEVMNGVSTLVNGNGSHDGGIDGILIDEEEGVMHLFQVKHSTGIGDNEVAKFINDYRNLFVFGNATSIPLNAKVTKAYDTYQALARSGRTIDTNLHFIFNGEITAQNHPLVERHRDADERLFVYDRNDLYRQIESLVSEHKKRRDVFFSFSAQRSNIALKSDPQALISFQIQNVKALNFRLHALELCKLLDREKEVNKRTDSVFAENIRGFLRNNQTNRRILETLESGFAEYFPFLNNGITLIAEQVKIPREMQAGFYPIETKNPLIVNGLQTTSVIYELYQRAPEKLEGVYVMVRLYETGEPELVEKITDATNTQSPISYRDKMSTKKFNNYVKELFLQNSIGYLAKRGDTFENSLSRSLNESIHSDNLLKFWYASFYERPDLAKNSKTRLLEDIYEATINRSHPLHYLFNGSPDSAVYMQLLSTYRIYRCIVQNRDQAASSNDLALYADELLCYGIHKLQPVDLQEGYATIFAAIERITGKEKRLIEQKGLTYSHNSYFKSAKSRYDLDAEMEFVEQAITEK